MNLSFFNERFQQQTSVNVVSWHPPPQSKKIKFFDTPLLAVILYKDKAIGFFLGFYIKNYMHFDITREDKI